ncbi:hypothetical protein [Streptomyces sp. NPDC005805]|uniref:hypothetical protein n=1 Tax=Streptomyces sp. NPDC005805 TaxID=3157068 RepID=UPI0033E2FC9B
MLAHALERGVLVITLTTDVDISERSGVCAGIARLVGAYAPLPVVVDLAMPVVGPAAVSAVVRAHRECVRLGVPMCAATAGAAARRLLRANVDTSDVPLGVYARAGDAVTAMAAAAIGSGSA